MLSKGLFQSRYVKVVAAWFSTIGDVVCCRYSYFEGTVHVSTLHQSITGLAMGAQYIVLPVILSTWSTQLLSTT